MLTLVILKSIITESLEIILNHFTTTTFNDKTKRNLMIILIA